MSSVRSGDIVIGAGINKVAEPNCAKDVKVSSVVDVCKGKSR